MHEIPKIIHQIWIGPKPAPRILMDTWKRKNPDFEYIFWNEEEIEKRGIVFECQEKIDMINEINGKADIIRWELLWRFGGVFLDADSICIEPFDDYFMCKSAFASYENERVRPELVATGTMGFFPKHPLCRDIIDWIKSDESSQLIRDFKAWFSVGPGVLTRFLQTGKYPDFSVFPSHVFLPVHFEGGDYVGHKKVYAHQYWGTNYQLYDSAYFSQKDILELPPSLKCPERWVSLILFSSGETPLSKIKECLDSVKCQRGHFGIEVSGLDGRCDDDSDIRGLVDSFLASSRFTKMTYHRFLERRGVEDCISLGKMLSSGSFVFLMDANYVMTSDRFQKQMEYLEGNPTVEKCGCHILNISENTDISPLDVNTTLCFRKYNDVVTKEDSVYMFPENLILWKKV